MQISATPKMEPELLILLTPPLILPLIVGTLEMEQAPPKLLHLIHIAIWARILLLFQQMVQEEMEQIPKI